MVSTNPTLWYWKSRQKWWLLAYARNRETAKSSNATGRLDPFFDSLRSRLTELTPPFNQSARCLTCLTGCGFHQSCKSPNPPVPIKKNRRIRVKNLAKKLSLVFAAGCLGGLLNSLAVWIFGEVGITSAFGVKIAPQLSALWLYPRIVWGGLWGFLFLLPFMRNRFIYRGLLFSLGPTIVQLLIIFPMKANKGVMGLDLGLLTPLAVFVFNAIWGLTSSIWLRWTNK